MIFTAAEIQLWQEWVRSLAAVPAAQATAAASPAEEMVRLVDALRPRQVGTPAHAGTKLAGPDPGDPEASVEQPFPRWFHQPALALLRALRSPDNGSVVAGESETSRFVTELVRGEHGMARAFAGPAGNGRSWAGVANTWIAAGRPLPGDDLTADLVVSCRADRREPVLDVNGGAGGPPRGRESLR